MKTIYNSTLVYLLILLASGNLFAQNPVGGTFSYEKELLDQGNFHKALASLQEKVHLLEEKNLSREDFNEYYLLLAQTAFFLDELELSSQAIKELLHENPDYTAEYMDVPETFKLMVEDLKSGKDPFAVDVYVTKHKQNSDVAPSVITVFTREQITELGARNLMDLIRLTPGFMEMGDQNERNVGTRGLFGSTVQHLLFLLNGHKLPDLYTSSTGPDWVSLDYVEQVEIIRGPGSALYGGNAMSGVINIVTRDGSKFKGVEASAFGGNGGTGKFNLQAGGGSAGGLNFYFSASAGFSNGFKLNQPAWRDLSETYTRDGVAETRPAIGGTEYINRYYPGYNILTIFNLKRLKLTVNAQSFSYAYNRPFGVYNLGGVVVDSTRSARRTDSREFIQAEYNLLPKTNSLQWSIKASFDHFRKDDFQPKGSTTAFPGPGKFNRILGDEVKGTFESQWSSNKIGFGKDRITIAGIEAIYFNQFYNWYFDDFEGDSSLGIQTSTQSFFSPKENPEVNLSAYAQTEGYFFNQILGITVGTRADYHLLYGRALSPRIALVYVQSDSLKFKVLLNQAFLPPPFLYRYNNPSFTGSDDITPQQIYSAEMSIFGTINNRFSYKLNGFYNQVFDYIRQETQIDPVTNTRFRIYNNQGTMQLVGAEGSAKFIGDIGASEYSLFGNFALTRNVGSDAVFLAQTDSLGARHLKNWPAFSINAGGSLRFPDGKILKRPNLQVSCNYWGPTRFAIDSTTYSRMDPSQVYPANFQGSSQEQELIYLIPSQFSLNLNLMADVKNLHFGCSIHNLLNNYELLPGTTPVPKSGEPTSIYLTLGYRFD